MLFFRVGDGLFEDPQAFVRFRFGDAERRGKADGGFAAAEQEQTVLKGDPLNGVADLFIRLASFPCP